MNKIDNYLYKYEYVHLNHQKMIHLNHKWKYISHSAICIRILVGCGKTKQKTSKTKYSQGQHIENENVEGHIVKAKIDDRTENNMSSEGMTAVLTCTMGFASDGSSTTSLNGSLKLVCVEGSTVVIAAIVLE